MLNPVQIPFTSLEVFPLCLGTGDMGGGVSPTDSYALLDAYVAHGGNFLDTALVYSDWLPGERSRSEKLIGAWMKDRRNRMDLVLATKGCHPYLDSMHIPRLSRADIESDVNASLSHLQTDWIDLYWLHRDDPRQPVEAVIQALNDQVRAGKIRYFGCSNWRVERLREANAYASAHGLQGFVADQVFWNLAVVDYAAIGDPTIVVMDEPLYQYHRESGLASIPFSGTANGLFHKLADGKFSSLAPLQQKVYSDPENLHRSERIHRLMEQTGLTLTQVVLGYLLSQPFAAIPIIGPRRLDHLLDSLQAAAVKLKAEDLAFLVGKPL
jgi:aryl-alcohol dehydrogenase-like predicted oxidoreductase